MTTATGNVALQVSEYIAGLRYQDLPAPVVQRAKAATLDAIGCMFLGHRIPLGPIIIQLARDLGGKAESTVVGAGFKTSCVNATLANATLVHADEVDEIGAGGHPGAVTVSPGLAVAEREGASGKDYITALVLGYDLQLRLAEAIDARKTLHLRSFSPAVLGFLPGAAIAAKLLGLPVAQVNIALGLAGATTGGLLAWRDGEGQHMTKAMVYGNSSSAGVRAALLAQRGFAGPPTIFQGRFDVINALAGKGDVSALTRDLGKRFAIVSTRFKKHSAGGPIHAPVDGLLNIMSEQRLQPEDLEEVTVQIPAESLFVVDHERMGDHATLNISLQYLLAVAAYDRKVTLESHSEERAKDPKVWELKRRIKLVGNEEFTRNPGMESAAIVEVRTRTGRRFVQRVEHPTGSPQNPMSQRDMEDKFFDLATKVVSREQAQRIMDTVGDLERVRSMRSLGSLVRGA